MKRDTKETIKYYLTESVIAITIVVLVILVWKFVR